MATESKQLDAATSFARGFLLASRWAGVPPDDDAADRIPLLAGKELGEEYKAIGLLPDDRRKALGSVWLDMEPQVRIDERLDPHWSWLAAEIESESPALVLQILGALKPELAKEALRALWPKLRVARPDQLEIGRPSPPLAAHLRRELLSRFILVADRPREEQSLAALLFLGRRELYLLVQDVGLREIANAGSSGAREEILRSFEALRGPEVTRVSRLLSKKPIAQSDEEEEIDPSVDRAVRLVRWAVETGGGNGDVVGLTGIAKLAIALAGEPKSFCLQIAHRMEKSSGRKLIEQRDEWAGREVEDRDEIASGVMERLRQVLSRVATPALAKGDE